MPQLAQWYFKFAVVFLLLGICMGLQMSISGNHNIIGAHAHTNLVGWVTSALFGAYFALNPAKAALRLATIQFWIYAVSIVVLTPSLYFFYLGQRWLEPLLGVSSLLALAAAMLFAYIVFTDAHKRAA